MSYRVQSHPVRHRPRGLSRFPRAAIAALGALVVAILIGMVGITPAQAVIAERWGFAYVDDPNPAAGCVLDPLRQASSSGQCIEVVAAAGGTYTLNFKGLAGKRGIVHVMAVDNDGHWCQGYKWGPAGVDLHVVVECYRPGGAKAPTRFSITYTASTGRPVAGGGHAYVHYDGPSGTIQDSYNSAGGVNTVFPGGFGQWTAHLPKLGTVPPAGNVQATAIDPNSGARCKVARWGSNVNEQIAEVRCFDSFGNPKNTAWTLSYHNRRAVYGAVSPPRNFAYYWDVLGVAPPAGTNFNSQGGVNSVISSGFGLRYFVFPRVGVRPSHVMVTSYGIGPEYCGMMYPWQLFGGDAVLRNVICFDTFGNPTNMTDSLVTFTSSQ